MRNRPYWAFAFMARYSLAMAALAIAFVLASWPPRWLPIEDDFPNCVSACWDGSVFAAGCVSIRQTCSVFLTTEDWNFDSRDRTGWYERRDGHFCNFHIPHTYDSNPTALNLHLGFDTIGWSVPYWMFAVPWLLVFAKTVSGTRWNLRDLLIAMSAVALLLAMFQLRIALVGILLLNASTLLLAAHFLTSVMRSFIHTDNILWPVLFRDKVDTA